MRQSDAWSIRLQERSVKCRADLAREEGVSRARVTQVLSLQGLCPEARSYLASPSGRVPSEAVLRQWSRLSAGQQVSALEAFVQTLSGGA